MAVPATAAERYAIVVAGVSGGSEYAEKQQRWTAAIVKGLTDSFGFPASQVTVLVEDGAPAARSTSESVRRAFADARRRLAREDLLLVVLIGHGTFDGETAKFNLPGPDLASPQWAEMLDPIAATLVVIDTTESSYPFLEALARRGRIVITATDSGAQRYATVFPEYLVRALASTSTDADRNGRVSVWELFAAASAGVREYYEQRGQLPTERPLLEDTGERVGREVDQPGSNGSLARATFLDAEVVQAGTSAAVAALQRRRAALEAQLDALKLRKGIMPPDQYDAALEEVLVNLAKLWREIRKGS